MVAKFISSVKFFIVILPALLTLFLVLRAIYDANVSDYRYALALLVIFAASLLVRPPYEPDEARRRKRWGRLLVILLPVLVLVPATFVVLVFGKMDMAAFVFHLVFGMDGTPTANFVPYGFTVLVYWSVFLASLFRAQYWLERVPFSTVAIALMLLAVNPVVWDLASQSLADTYKQRPSFVEDFKHPELKKGANKPNLVIIYLEGLERSYNTLPPAMAEAYAPLDALALEGINLTGVDQLHGTAWSLAGTVASRCGVPVLPNGLISARDYGDVKLIAPNLTCLDDILHAKGYDVSYISTTRILGNKMGFYGFDNYFTTHGTEQIYDLGNIEYEMTADVAKSFANDWGLRDAHAFAKAEKLIAAALDKDAPFAVTVATMDTHGPVALMSQSCTGGSNKFKSSNMIDAVHCTARLTSAFVEKVRDMTKGTDTRIAIMSDHLAHHNNLYHLLEKAPRRNTAILLDGPFAPQVIDSHAAMFDIFPTLLHWLGWLEGKQAGIGVSLLSDEATLVQTHGVDEVNARLKVDLDLSRVIWNMDGHSE
ncbi:sulfatase-like hydrolase/transferase [Neptunicoccus cionae]|uniref:Sulfatase N-terminal domain-containing protein n=1 Tax=Neptunicoccus cionae TaxID=2035344 RepID=A0A916QS86_9RHOB|nr:sulfatase-like hydrolase/transferase [Amylibacter cionae]GGA08150.1 hypothetical protein GCM10011498_05020 [Amylibacter cionae]